MANNTPIQSVQVLRAVAAVAVVTQHLTLLGNGSWGVDVFFAISGFIIAYVTEQSSSHFLLNRVIRLVPLYWLGTLAVFLVGSLHPEHLNNGPPSLSGLAKSLFFIPYLKGTEVHPILFLGWTLNYEMFFYVLFYLAMTISHARRIEICSAALLAFVVAGMLLAPQGVLGRFYTADILLEFIFGMLIFRLHSHPAMRSPGSPLRALLITVSLCGLLTLPVLGGLLHEFPRVLRWGLVSALVVACVLLGFGGRRMPAVLVAVGDASYSLYLFHPYLIMPANKVIAALPPPLALHYLAALLCVGLSCLMAWVGYRLLERPVTSLLRHWLHPRPALPIIVVAVESTPRG